MKRIPHLLALLTGLLATVAVAGGAGAQDLTAERVQYAIGVTDRHIEEAQSLVTGSNNANAQLELNAAVDLQSRARNALSANLLGIALRLTFDARAHADRAIAIIRGLPDPERVLAQLERTREILQRARDRIEECGNDRARSLLRAAMELQSRAEAAARDSRFLAALQLTMSAREKAFRALRLCKVEEGLADAAQRALGRTDEVISRARDAVTEHGGEAARQALARAQELQEDAYREFRAGHYEASLRLTQSARAFANRALRQSGGGR